jgi:antitoxin component YwqK of YwqJK toxin-antitoxin module
MGQKNIYLICALCILIILILLIFDFNDFNRLYLIVSRNNGSITHFDNSGKLSGEVFIYSNGKMRRKESFKNGLLNGWATNYYTNGVIMKRGYYKNNKIDGIEFTYYDNGKIKCKETFRNGMDDGTKISYYQNGQIEQILSRKNNKDEGMEYAYYEDGHLKYKRNWVDDNPYGDFFYYYKNKAVQIYHTYDISGEKFYLCRYDSLGMVLKNEGDVFSSRTYTVDNDSTKVLLNGNSYKSLKDLYITVANPPQYTPEIRICINKTLCKKLIFPNHNTILVKNAFVSEGTYVIVIEGIFVNKFDTSDYTIGELKIKKVQVVGSTTK